MKIRMGTSARVVHINRTRPFLQGEIDDTPVMKAWNPPNFCHVDGSDSGGDSEACGYSDNPSAGSQVVTRSGQVIRPPDYYGY